jgi:hypothetical protein
VVENLVKNLNFFFKFSNFQKKKFVTYLHL